MTITPNEIIARVWELSVDTFSRRRWPQINRIIDDRFYSKEREGMIFIYRWKSFLGKRLNFCGYS